MHKWRNGKRIEWTVGFTRCGPCQVLFDALLRDAVGFEGCIDCGVLCPGVTTPKGIVRKGKCADCFYDVALSARSVAPAEGSES